MGKMDGWGKDGWIGKGGKDRWMGKVVGGLVGGGGGGGINTDLAHYALSRR